MMRVWYNNLIEDNVIKSWTLYSRYFPQMSRDNVLLLVAWNTLLKSDVTRRDHVSVVMDAGSRIVNFIVNFIRDGTVFA